MKNTISTSAVIKISRIFAHDRKSSQGYVIPFCAFLMAVIFIMASFVIDIGNARYQKRNIQIISDAASMAGLAGLGNPANSYAIRTGNNFNAVRAIVNDIASRNGATASEVATITIECGSWSLVGGNWTFAPRRIGGSPVCGSPDNAVQVTMIRQVNTFFGRIMNTEYITPNSLAVSALNPLLQCARPFGIERTWLESNLVNNQFVVNTASPGNWGKLDVYDANNFSVTTDTCHPDLQLNAQPDPRTGFAQMKTEFGKLRNGDEFIVPLVSQFPQGGSNPVTIIEFAKIRFRTYNSASGQNFSATFEVVARNLPPNADPVAKTRALVK